MPVSVTFHTETEEREVAVVFISTSKFLLINLLCIYFVSLPEIITNVTHFLQQRLIKLKQLLYVRLCNGHEAFETSVYIGGKKRKSKPHKLF